MTDWKQEIRRRLAGLNIEPTRESEIVEELAQHLSDRYDELQSRAGSEEDARRSVIGELDDASLFKRELGRIEKPVAALEPRTPRRRMNMVSDIHQDLRFSLRMLRKNLGFTATALFTLALGIGANAAIFTLVNTAILRPLPIEQPSQLVALNNTSARQSFPTFSYPNYKDFRDRNEVFDGLIAYRFSPLSVSFDGQNERLWGYEVTGNYFDLLGVKPALGRLLSSDDDVVPGAHPVTVVSYKYWLQRFGAEPSIIGKQVVVNGLGYTIIGVAPQGFFGTEVVTAVDLWFPMAMQAQIEPGSRWLDAREIENIFVQGRLKPGIDRNEASAALDVIGSHLAEQFPEINKGKRVTISEAGLYGTAMRGPALGFAGLLMGVVGIVLLLACTNLANLLLARATERKREIGVRLSLGASRLRVVRQLLTESLLLSIGGGICGLALAYWLASLVGKLKLPIDIPMSMDPKLDYRVLLFTVGVSLLTGVLFGLLPALQATRTDLINALKDETVATGRRWSLTKSGLIILQVALSLVLLVGGGLMLRALGRAQTIDLGYTPENAVELSFDLRLQSYTQGRAREFQKRLLDRIRARPEVDSAAIADMIPVDLHFSRDTVFIEGQIAENAASVPRALTSRISPGYFETMNTRLIRGRDFADGDDQNSARVAVVNEAFARRFWPGEDPIGKRFSMGSVDAPKWQVIGVAQNGKYAGLNEDPRPFVYRPILQSYSGATTVVARAKTDPQTLISALRAEVQELDPQLPVSSARTLVERLALPLLPARLVASLFTIFGLLALVLAAIGTYGVISYSVTQRTREIGIRIALGAQKASVLKLVIAQAVKLMLIGVGAGVAAALALASLMKSVLFGVSTTDPLTYLGVAVLLASVALLACYIPARRATRLDPMAALRHE